MPDTEDRPSSANGLKKRRRSEESEPQESKRQRISPGKASPTKAQTQLPHTGKVVDTPICTNTAAASPPRADPRDAKRKSGVADEKQRSKRLFGALLGNLNQPGGDRTSKRRREIEARRKAEVQRQDDERLRDKVRRVEVRDEERRVAQGKVDEVNVSLHSSSVGGLGWADEV